MAFDNYKKAFSRMLIALDPICSYYNKSKLYFIWDALKCHFRYGVTPNEYIGFAFFKKSHLDKKEFYTLRHSKKFETKFNDQTKADIFNKKELTLKTFSDFVKRDWIFAPEKTIDEIRSFISSHKKMIVKPNNLSSGRGIHVLTDKDDPESYIKNECLIEEFVTQHPSLSAINSTSVNTIRIYSIKTSNLLRNSKLKWGGGYGSLIILLFSVHL